MLRYAAGYAALAVLTGALLVMPVALAGSAPSGPDGRGPDKRSTGKDAPESQPAGVRYDRGEPAMSYLFAWNDPNSEYLRRLRDYARLDDRTAHCRSDFERCQVVCAWVHGLWKHTGNNEPKKRDPLSILEEVAKGQRFRCVEYSIVINGCLNALGIPSRVLGLKMQDVETRQSGAGHVVAEAWLRDQTRWCMIDGQWNAIPMLGEQPLSGVELQEALARHDPKLSIAGKSKGKAHEYFDWVEPYLYYFDVRLDGRIGQENTRPNKLMLVPAGAKTPMVFQRKSPMKHMQHTTFVRAFYPEPGLLDVQSRARPVNASQPAHTHQPEAGRQ